MRIPDVGGNLEEIQDFSHSQVFADLVKQSRVFGDPSRPFEPGTVQRDVDGWPTTDFGVVLFVDAADQRNYGGTYKLFGTFSRKPTIQLVSGSPGEVKNVTFDAATGAVKADIDFPEGGEQMMLGFTNTGGGTRNLKVMRPGFGPTKKFTNVFINHIRRFSRLRFMDWTQTNGSQQISFADRPRLSSAQYTIKGVPWEIIIDLCNLTHKSPWINIPAHANDNYVRNLAKLFKAKLDPTLTVHVEYSNEVWNFGFEQAQFNLDAARAEVEGGNPDLNFDNADDQFFWAARRIGRRITQISNLFRAEYGDIDFLQHVKPILAPQTAFPELWLDQALFYISKRKGPPNFFLGGLAFAPYYNMGDQQFVDGLSVDQVLAALNTEKRLAPVTYKYEYNRAKALWFGLETFAYEGGSDTFGNGSLDAKRAVNLDLRTRDTVSTYLKDWFAFDFGPFLWYHAGANSWSTPFGTWGLTEDMANQSTPKIFGIDAVLNGSPIRITAGMLIPSNVDARKHIARFPDFATRDPFLRFLRQGDVFDYLVRVDTEADFKIDCLTASESTEGLLSICFDGIRSTTVAVPNTGSLTTFKVTAATPTIHLKPGLHTIRLRIERGSFVFNIKTIRVQQL
ncbi:MAG: carbohydrate-binding protein [Fimbriimonas sp.]